MKDYRHIDRYLSELYFDVYPQPPDVGHTAWAIDAVVRWSELWSGSEGVLDVGCGEAFLQGVFTEQKMSYSGVCLGDDYTNAVKNHKTVYNMDFHFLGFPDQSFDIVFSRHSLEHSPMPILALMEWHRVSKKFLGLILPNPEYWGRVGKNHYSVMYADQAKFLLERAHWEVIDEQETKEELRFLCKRLG